MQCSISATSQEMGKRAAEKVAELIRETVKEKGKARLLVSTGQSQFEFFEEITAMDIPWEAVEIFHLDEYIGLPITHPASFRKHLKERFIDKIGPAQMHYISGEGDIAAVIDEVTESIRKSPIDIGIIGIGENGHIAFNDPPADFETKAAYHVVSLDERCRMQQVGEGWFGSLDEVPRQAISATVPQILSCRTIVSIVPHKVKAEAVRNTLEAPAVTNLIPATALREHPQWYLYLDADSASLLKK